MSKAKTKAALIAQLEINLKDMEMFQSGFKELESKLRASQLETRLRLLETKYKESEKLYQTIAGMDDIEEYVKGDTWTTILRVYMELQPDLKDAYDKLVKTTPDLNVSVSTQQDFAPPRLNVPPFDGTYESWPAFKNTLDAYFFQYSSMSNIQKLNVLKTKVVGDAAILIQHLNLEESGYKSAMTILTDRYENKRILVNAQLRMLLNQPQITSESAVAIKTMLDTTNAAYHSLKNLQILVEGWNSILIFLLVQKLPFRTQQLWEEKIGNSRTIPEFTTFKDFLENRFRTLESVQRNQPNYNKSKEIKPAITRTLHMTSSTGIVCVMCKESHSIRNCQKFQQLTPNKRLEFVKTKELCWNCLGEGHKVPRCPSKYKCRECQKQHHTLLHLVRGNGHAQSFETSTKSHVQANNCVLNPEVPEYQPGSQQDLYATQSLASCMVNKSTTQQILLATALVKVIAPSGREIVLKALLDQGSQASFITEKIAQKLQLSREKVAVNIQGVGSTQKQKTNSRVSFIVRSLQNMSQLNVQGFILKKITDITLGANTQWQHWSHLQGIALADPKFYESSNIDVLLGADVFTEIILNGVIKGGHGRPLAQNSIFGWILSGEIRQEATSVTIKSCHLTLDNQLKKFWELEEILDGTKIYTEEERRCEHLYNETTIRLPTGKYKVSLPISDISTNYLGASKQIATRRFHQLEARFKRDARFKAEYSKVINEYIQLGHMAVISREERLSNYKKDIYSSCYLPHHGVIKESSSTTKLRVVFDASQPTESGNSLNDILLNGPVIQDELVRLFIRWRKHKIAFTADIEKMYRQIWVDERHADYQRIIWRENQEEPINEYKLLTVTFGTKSAPYLAIKTIQQLARDESKNYPAASKITLSDFYVDDLLSGTEDVESALKIQKEMINMMQSGGFPIRKWMSNAEELRLAVQDTGQEKILPLTSENTDEVRTLGISWNPISDKCHYAVNFTNSQSTCSKRSILSQIAKLFDPLGWLAPTIIIGKLILQKLWLDGLSWDDEVNPRLRSEWITYYNNLPGISTIQVPRWLQYSIRNAGVELHVFADASVKAYAAVAYLCTTDQVGRRTVNLIAAKTKVAPIKTISLPRLELCAASLAANLLQMVKQSLKINEPITIYGWTDSEIVLAWLREHPSRWTTFVANRVSHIHNILEKNVWSHVPTKENPADCATRGLYPKELSNFQLWWSGPEWLSESSQHWPRKKQVNTELEKRKVLKCHVSTTEDVFEYKFSSLTKLARVVAYCHRFITNSRQKSIKLQYHLKAHEIDAAMERLLIRSQTRSFHEDIKLLKDNKPISNKNGLIKLNPFLDENGMLRVGGRLINASDLNYDEKYPIILKDKDHFTILLIHKMHKETLHGGSQLMLSHIRKKYWIINARNSVRYYIQKCITCFKQKAQTRQQLMGNLPSTRVQMARPFSNSGLDYCGPFEIKYHKYRGSTKYKAYIALFVCMATKAIHLELVSDMTSEGFIAAFRRFCARRGLCKNIYCDNGTNFVGGYKILTKQSKNMIKNLNIEIAELMENNGVAFHFNPPASPHFGGLWEAGVKATKYHLKRILDNTSITFEEFNTVLCQVEACLNSRPLTEISSDPQDFTPLTPAHFLIGDSMLASPQEEVADLNVHRLTRWQYLQSLVQNFWRRWNSEYLSRLQQRPKWTKQTENLKQNQLILLKEDNLPPNKWLLGRIIEVHPGSDGLVRVVTVRTKSTILKRPISKICLLPDD